MSSTLINELFNIRNRKYSHADIQSWVVRVFSDLFGLNATSIRTEVKIPKSRGIADIIVEENIIIEVKKSLQDEFEDAKAQLDKYKTSNSTLIACDGVNWFFFTISALGELVEVYKFEITPEWSDEKLANELQRVISVMRSETKPIRATSGTILEYFGENTYIYNTSFKILQSIFERCVNEEKYDALAKFKSWYEVFSYVYNKFDEKIGQVSVPDHIEDPSPIRDIAERMIEKDMIINLPLNSLSGAILLFIKHTYLSILAKVLAASVVVGNEELIKRILDNPNDVIQGKLLSDNGVYIFDPNDYFTWPIAIGDTQSIERLLVEILNVLKKFEPIFDEDIFRELYEQIVDSATRHEIGEFYTPKWIVQYIIRNTIKSPNDYVLDPACGSGTFLVEAMKYKYKLSNGKVSSKEMIETIWGLDINPLSVILSQVNMYIVLSNLYKDKPLPPGIKFNVFVADSLSHMRSEKMLTTLESYRLQEKIIPIKITKDVIFPISRDVVSIRDRIIKKLDQYIKIVFNIIYFDKKELLDNLDPNERIFTEKIVEKIKELQSKYGDGVWFFVLRNYIVPLLLLEKFDVVVGNPPWLVYRDADKDIQNLIDFILTKQEVDRGINLRPPAKVKTSFNLAIVFFVASMEFLKSGGRIGFVMPYASIDSPSHLRFLEKIQELYNEDIEIKVVDISEIKPNPFPHGIGSVIIISRRWW